MSVINIYVDLDSLLDVRAGSLITLYGDKHSVIEDLMKVDYKNRQNDDFNSLLEYANNESVKDLISSKSVEVLRNSVMTSIIYHILEVGKMIESKNVKIPLLQEYRLTLDIGGYDLTQLEIDMFKDILTHMLPTFSFNILNITLENLTPSRIKSDFDVVFIYDLNYWLGKHSDSLAKCNMPAVYLFAPALYHGVIPTEEETVIEGMGPVPPFMLIENFLLEFISLQLIDPSNYTYIDLNA